MATFKKKENGAWTTQSNPTQVGIEKTVEPLNPATINITSNGTYTPSGSYNCYSQASVNVPVPVFPTTILPGDTPVLGSASGKADMTSGFQSLKATGVSITIPMAGTYRFKWCNLEGNTSQLYKNGTAVSELFTNGSWANTYYYIDLACAAGDVVEVWASAKKNSSYYYGGISQLVACIDWEI